jgi:hypothetical protein
MFLGTPEQLLDPYPTYSCRNSRGASSIMPEEFLLNSITCAVPEVTGALAAAVLASGHGGDALQIPSYDLGDRPRFRCAESHCNMDERERGSIGTQFYQLGPFHTRLCCFSNFVRQVNRSTINIVDHHSKNVHFMLDSPLPIRQLIREMP